MADGLNDKWKARTYRDEDAPTLSALWTAGFKTDGLPIVVSVEEIRADFTRPGFDPARHSIVLEDAGSGDVAGFGRVVVTDDEESGELEYNLLVAVRPELRPLGLERALAQRLVSLCREDARREDRAGRARVKATYFCSTKQVSQKALSEELAMPEVRRFWDMECPLNNLEGPAEVPGVIIRPYRVPEDNEAALAAFNDSFTDHYGSHPSDAERWEHRINHPSMRVDLSRLAEVVDEPGKIAGFCLCGAFEEENRATGRNEGWIELLGTTRDWRRKGLGRALLLHGLHALKGAGFDMGVLGVDSESLTGAQRLYESVGFRVRNVWLRHECPLDEVRA